MRRTIPEEINASFGKFWKSVFPHHWIVVLYLDKFRRQIRFVCRESSLTSGRKRVLEVNDIAGGFLGVCGEREYFILTSIFSSFSFQFKLYV